MAKKAKKAPNRNKVTYLRFELPHINRHIEYSENVIQLDDAEGDWLTAGERLDLALAIARRDMFSRFGGSTDTDNASDRFRGMSADSRRFIDTRDIPELDWSDL